jgi:hypothetical protein
MMTERPSYASTRLYELERDLNSQLKRSSEMGLETNFHIAQKANDVHFKFATAPPEVAREAIGIATQEHSIIYLDYLQKLTRLNEELADRMMDASTDALEKCVAARERADQRKVKRKPVVSTKPKRSTKRKGKGGTPSSEKPTG